MGDMTEVIKRWQSGEGHCIEGSRNRLSAACCNRAGTATVGPRSFRGPGVGGWHTVGRCPCSRPSVTNWSRPLAWSHRAQTHLPRPRGEG